MTLSIDHTTESPFNHSIYSLYFMLPPFSRRKIGGNRQDYIFISTVDILPPLIYWNFMYEITIKKTFSAAHNLKDIGGRCEQLHGHNFTVEVSLASKKLNEEGLLIDFRILEGWIEEILDKLDHKFLNDTPHFKNINPSSENIAKYIYDRVYEKVNSQKIDVSRITVWESENARVSYNGEE